MLRTFTFKFWNYFTKKKHYMSSSQALDFKGRVVIVTGAGGGLGRQYALAFAKKGASIVVNDLGVDRSGKDSSMSPAEKVVQEIIQGIPGGKAVANYDSVENGEKIVETAIDKFGRIDVVINNAGILRDKSFLNMTVEDWDIIHRIHLRGSFLVTKAAWPYMKKQGFGRIIMTSSAAGIYGNYGQANYSAAKLGLLGLSNTLAVEGAKYNIFCNTIAPIAGSRLTETVMPPDLVEQLKPEYVAPVVVYLCHESSNENGSLFEVGAGWVTKLRWEGTQGSIIRRKNEEMTPELVREKWAEIVNFENSRHPASIQESTQNFINVLSKIDDGDENSTSDLPNPSAPGLERFIGLRFPEHKFQFSAKDVVLYALGVGVSTRDPNTLKFLYEGSDEFQCLPTFSVVPSFAAFFALISSGKLSSLGLDLTQLLHGEHYLKVYKPVWPTEGIVHTTVSVTDVMDKGRGAIVLFDVETKSESGELLSLNQFATYVSGAGNYGGKRNSDKIQPLCNLPNRAPDVVHEDVTSVDQAALYRLSGDYNPLHIDPNFSALGGQPKPILHGLCTFGFAARQVLKHYLKNNSAAFDCIKVRFTKPVIPGQTIITEMWKEGSRIHIQCKVKETGEICLSGGYVDVIGEVANSSTTSSSSANKTDSPPAAAVVTTDVVFAEIGERIKANPRLCDTVKAIYQWNILRSSKLAEQWIVDLKNKPGSVYKGECKGEKAGCTLVLEEDVFMDLISGKINPEKAFFSGKLKLQGNIMLSQKLSALLKDQAKL